MPNPKRLSDRYPSDSAPLCSRGVYTYEGKYGRHSIPVQDFYIACVRSSMFTL